jgi:maltose alpha-D-glucosyltransferase/alpha-amylase
LLPENTHILAYLRTHEGRTALMIGNLADSTQTVALDLRDYAGMVPSDLLSNERLSDVADDPYVLTLPAYGYRCLVLEGSN